MSTRSVIARPTTPGHFRGRYHHWDGYPSGVGVTLVELYNGIFKQDLGRMLKVLLDDHPAGWSTINGANFRLKPGYGDDGFKGKCQDCGLHSDAHYIQTYVGADKDRNGRYKVKRTALLHKALNAFFGEVERDDIAMIRHLKALADSGVQSYLIAHSPNVFRPADGDRRPACYCHGKRSEEAWDCDDTNAAGSGCKYAYVLGSDGDGDVMDVLSSYTKKGQKMIGALGSGDPNSEWRVIATVRLDQPENAINILTSVEG